MRYFSGFLVHGYSITFNSLLSGRSRRRFIIPLCRACSSSISCNILSRNLAVIRLLGATPPIACESCCLFSADLGKNAAMGLDGSVEPGTPMGRLYRQRSLAKWPALEKTIVRILENPGKIRTLSEEPRAWLPE